MEFRQIKKQVTENLTEIFNKHAADVENNILSVRNAKLCADLYSGIKAAKNSRAKSAAAPELADKMFEKFNRHMAQWEAENSRFEQMTIGEKDYTERFYDAGYGAFTPVHAKQYAMEQAEACSKIALALFK